MAPRFTGIVLGLTGLVSIAACAGLASASTPLGPTFRIDSASGLPQAPKVEADASGRFVVVWNDYEDMSAKARRFDASGSPLAPEFQVNQETRIDRGGFRVDGAVSVAVKPSGDFVVVWHGSEPGVDTYPYTFLRLFDGDGNPRGDEFSTTVPAFDGDQALNPEISMDAAGEFVVVWEGLGYSNPPGYPQYAYPDESVFGQIYDSAGNPRGGEFQADVWDYSYQAEYGGLDVARAKNGDSFVVVWDGAGAPTAYDPYGTNGVHGRLFAFDRPGAKQFTITTESGGPLAHPQVAMDDVGNFMVIWGAARGRRYTKAGVALGDAFDLIDLSGDDFFYGGGAVEADAEGNFIVVWSSNDDVRGQVFDALGNRRGDPFAVGFPLRLGRSPDVATLGNGEFVVTWQGLTATDLESFGVFARRFAMAPLTEVPLPGRSLLIRNGAADVEQLRSAAWSTHALNVASPVRGTSDDPRCNGDAAGTVKSSLRFFSSASGSDSGEIGLPCQGWSATGPASNDPLARQGYRYKNAQGTDGPCSSVVLRRTRSLKASCRGLPYDLVAGVDQGTVHAVLTLGQVRYCASFPGSAGADGSDGLRFQGANSPAPEACPTP